MSTKPDLRMYGLWTAKTLLVLCLALVLCVVPGVARFAYCDDEYVEVKTISLQDVVHSPENWYATVYEMKEDEEKEIYLETSNVPAKICFWHDASPREQSCSFAEVDGKGYQVVGELSVIQIQQSFEPKKGLLFAARYVSPTIGEVHWVSLWVYSQKEKGFVNALPSVELTEDSEYRCFPFLDRHHGVFVTTDRIWKFLEESYGSPLHFTVKIYELSPGGPFRLVGKYATKKRYQYNSRSDSYEVIKGESENIRKLLHRVKS